MGKIYFIVLGIVFLGFAAVKPACAQGDTQQLTQKINLLENRIQQLQTQLNQREPFIYYTPWFDYGYPWDPFVQMQDMQQQINRLMNEMPTSAAGKVFNLNVEKVSMEQTPREYLVTIHVPGMQMPR